MVGSPRGGRQLRLIGGDLTACRGKPLDLMAGQSVFVTGADDGNHNVILETVLRGGSRFIMVQEYVSEIESSGDKRLLFTGIDVIGDFMTKINVTSPTGIRELERQARRRRVALEVERRHDLNLVGGP